MDSNVVESIGRKNQLHLMSMLLSSKGPRFGDHMDDRVIFISSMVVFMDWFYRSPRTTEIETMWTTLIDESAVLSSARGKVAVFCVPAVVDDHIAGLRRGDYLGTVQIRRTADHRILVWADPRLARHTALMQTHLIRLRLNVIGPMIEARRVAAEQKRVHEDRIDDVLIRLKDVMSEEDRIGFLLDDTVTTPPRCFLPMLYEVLLRPLMSGTDSSSLFFSFVDYARQLRDWRVRAPPDRKQAPKHDLDGHIVYGEIARCAFTLVSVDNHVTSRVCLFTENEQDRNPGRVRNHFDDTTSAGWRDRLLLCPLNYMGHWTLLYRCPGDRHAWLLDSLTPKVMGQSSHCNYARKFASDVVLASLPVVERQTGAECGLYVITAAVSLISSSLKRELATPPLNSMRYMVGKAYAELARYWTIDPDTRDVIIMKQMAAMLANNATTLITTM